MIRSPSTASTTSSNASRISRNKIYARSSGSSTVAFPSTPQLCIPASSARCTVIQRQYSHQYYTPFPTTTWTQQHHDPCGDSRIWPCATCDRGVVVIKFHLGTMDCGDACFLPCSRFDLTPPLLPLSVAKKLVSHEPFTLCLLQANTSYAQS